MKSPGLKACVLAVGIIVIMLNAGCEKEQLPDKKKARIIAAENMQLKKQLQRRDSEIEKLKGQRENVLKKPKELLAECQEEKKYLEEALAEKFDSQMNEFSGSLIVENEKMFRENENLKQQIEKLKTELEEIKKLTKQPDKPL